MDILIFSKAPFAYEPARFYSESLKRGLKAKLIEYSKIDLQITKNGVWVEYEGNPLPSTKYAIFRAAGGDEFYIPQRDFLLEMFLRKGGRVLNSKTYRIWPRLDKITQHFEFFKGHLPFVESKVYGSNDRVLTKEKKFPFIIKKNLSSQGKDVFKPGNIRGLTGIFERGYFARTMLIQPFLKSGEDLRVVVIGGKAIGAMVRIAKKGKYLTNYSQGGDIKNFDLAKNPEVAQIAENAAEHFSLDYGGIDLMKDEKGNWKLLEINRACQFKGFEKATGINVPEKVLDFFLGHK